MDLFNIIESDLAEIGVINLKKCDYNEVSEFYSKMSKLKNLAIQCGVEKRNNHYTACCWCNVLTHASAS